MIEVEAKIKISENEVDKFRLDIKKLAKFTKKERKIDDYYTLENCEKYPRKSLRVRKRGGFYEVNFKKKLSYIKGVYAKNEIEFKTKEIEGYLLLLEDFGFKKWLTKEKVTELYEIKKNFHIELNKVKGLGHFIEVEYLCLEKNVERARKEVYDVIEKLGVSKKEIISEGYTKMLWNKK